MGFSVLVVVRHDVRQTTGWHGRGRCRAGQGKAGGEEGGRWGEGVDEKEKLTRTAGDVR